MSEQTRTHIADRKVTVLGAARSGMAAAELLSRSGASVFVSDAVKIDIAKQSRLDALGIGWEDCGHSEKVYDADFIVVSPGVPDSAPVIQEAFHKALPVYSEIELASWFCRGRILAISGSNGKTTTTELTGHIFRESGCRTWVCGNVGVPFSGVVSDVLERDVVVLEVSSFQLDHTKEFRPDVAVLLNITPDHLDRYEGDINLYAQSKLRMCRQQSESDVLVYNADDERLARFAKGLENQGPKGYPISISQPMDQGGFLENEELVLNINNKKETLMHVDELALRGRHNVYNSLAAAVAARVMEVRSDVVRESLRTFEGVPHRLEPVREVEGVRYVNDSKATNVNAVWYALESFKEPIIWIAGGRDKGNDYAALQPLVQNRVRSMITIGEASQALQTELGHHVDDSVRAEDLEEAIKLAQLLARPGDIVLLSPACASFDQFDSYEHRGDVFRQLVSNL